MPVQGVWLRAVASMSAVDRAQADSCLARQPGTRPGSQTGVAQFGVVAPHAVALGRLAGWPVREALVAEGR